MINGSRGRPTMHDMTPTTDTIMRTHLVLLVQGLRVMVQPPGAPGPAAVAMCADPRHMRVSALQIVGRVWMCCGMPQEEHAVVAPMPALAGARGLARHEQQEQEG